MNVGIVGAGYVGLTTAAGLAKNTDVYACVCESNPERLKALLEKECPIKEPGLEDALFNTPPHAILFLPPSDFCNNRYDVVFVCVGTPSGPDGEVDLSQIHSAVEDILQYKHKVPVIVIRSTVPPGTTRSVRANIELTAPYTYEDAPIVCHHPEFLQQGSALSDFDKASRIVFGLVDKGDQAVVHKVAKALYKDCGIMYMKAESSELSKYANNVALATRISFVNELARMANAGGADYEDVRMVIGMDDRIGNRFLAPGIGWGGSCIPKDIRGLIDWGRRNFGPPVECPVISAALETNTRVEIELSRTIKRIFGLQMDNRRDSLVVDGMTFKSGTDDTRNSIILSALVPACLTLPDLEIYFVDPIARADSFKDFGMLGGVRNKSYKIKNYKILNKYITESKILGIILSQESITNVHDFVEYVRNNTLAEKNTTVLDCRPTKDKQTLVMDLGLRYIPFVG